MNRQRLKEAIQRVKNKQAEGDTCKVKGSKTKQQNKGLKSSKHRIYTIWRMASPVE